MHPLFFQWLLPNGGTLRWMVKEDGRSQRNTCNMYFSRNLMNWDLGEIPHLIVEACILTEYEYWQAMREK